MAVERKLTIAMMTGRCWLQFDHIGNADAVFEGVSGSALKVTRSVDGRTYTVECDVPHIRVFVKLMMPDDYPRIYWRGASSAYGWWQVDGYEMREFPIQKIDANDPVFTSADAIRGTEPSRLGEQMTAERW